MNYTLIFFDTETTGNTDKDYLCQIAWKEYKNNNIQEGLFKPPVPMSIESMAVCHITNKMLEGKPAFRDSILYKEFNSLTQNPAYVFIAHNAKFDLGMLNREDIQINTYIDTLKIARFLDKKGTLPKYNLQYLRYYYEIEIEAIAHDASGDILVLEAIFEHQKNELKEMLHIENEDDVIHKMVTISYEPMLIQSFTFGKHIGKTLEEVSKIDSNYLRWLLEQKLKTPSDTEEDWIYTLKHYLQIP